MNNSKDIGTQMHDLIIELFPICRSITGNGVRHTHEIIKNHIPLKTFEIPTGTIAFDWSVPKEWNINDAYVIDPDGSKIVDFKISNLHVMGYSIPIDGIMSLEELKKHIHTIPESPNLIPYRLSPYYEDWGICMSQNQLESLKDGDYNVKIDSTLESGSLTYSECYIPGMIRDEVLISCYTCHPSLCNDNLSGVAICTFLAKYLMSSKNLYSYRILFIPETIGSIVWLSRNELHLNMIKYGVVVTCAGDSGNLTWKKTKQGNNTIDRIAIMALRDHHSSYNIVDFSPIGSDERQFCSLGFDLPVGSLMRTPYNQYPEYHTSGDNLDFVKPESLADSYTVLLDMIGMIENNRTYLNRNPKCEPHLGKYGLYRKTSGKKLDEKEYQAIFWVLAYSDGSTTLLDIAEKSKLPFKIIKESGDMLLNKGLLELVVESC